MAILHIDTFTRTKAPASITCLKCGGDLKPTGNRKVIGKIVCLFLKDNNKKRHYECDNCKQKYTVI